ncbi:MAG: hypothetical protein RBT19_13860 [Tenuifilaceae bacterium]|jgi:hypothetical protein|nr:hypothetical protein [Tenuifilaceae bacterium]
MRKILSTAALWILAILSAYPQEEQNLTPDYVNGVFYYKRLDYMRHSYDKARMLHREGYGGMLGGIFSVMYDFNWGVDTDRLQGRPMMLGFALGDGNQKKWGFHFLGYGTGNATNRDLSKEFKAIIAPDRYRAYTIGASYDLGFVSLTADATLANGMPSIYGRVFVPFLKTHIGVGTSQFDEVIDPIDNQKKIIKSNVLNIDNLSFATSLIPYFNLGLKIFRISQIRYAPNIYLSAHQFVKSEKWDRMKWDADLFFETRTGKVQDLKSLEDYDIRFTLYRMGNSMGGSSTDKPIDLRYTAFVGVSYKSEVDLYSKTLTESGMVYNGQHGFGFETGVGIRVLGFKRLGFEEDTYVRLSYYYNYSGYYERFPGMGQGVKFKVIL